MASPVVILGANFYTALGAIRTLGRRGIDIYALDYHFPTAYAINSRYVTKKICIPDINIDEIAVVEYLLETGNRYKDKPVLMATADNYALMISRNADALSEFYLFPMNENGLLEQIIDKKGLHYLANKHDLRTPLTFIADSKTDLEKIIATITYPCIIKPALSHKFVKVFRHKCLFASNEKELREALERAKSSQLEVMVQEIIPGFDDHMFVFDYYVNQSGAVTHTFTAQKLRQFPINFGSSTLTHHLYVPQLAEMGTEYVKRIGHRGYGEIEFKKHPDTGLFYMIEINARLSTLNVLFDKCNIEFTYIMYCDLIGKPLPELHVKESQQWAFWHAYEDIISSYEYLKTKQLTLGEIIKPWLKHRKAHAIWAADDPRPFFSFIRVLAAKLIKKVARKLRIA